MLISCMCWLPIKHKLNFQLYYYPLDSLFGDNSLLLKDKLIELDFMLVSTGLKLTFLYSVIHLSCSVSKI